MMRPAVEDGLSERNSQGDALQYLQGFGNDLETEALPNALPRGRNSPQLAPLGLVNELISGTTFSAPRNLNKRTHVYRIRPSVAQMALLPMPAPEHYLTPPLKNDPTPNQMRWSPFEIPSRPQDFLDGLLTLCGNGSAINQFGMSIHVYLATKSMTNRAFSNADGEMLVVPQLGSLRMVTEMGVMIVRPGEFAVLPRGIKCRVDLVDAHARGYMCENYGLPFRLPELGIIGATGQANAYDFAIPVAAYEDVDVDTELVHKYCGAFWKADLKYSPFDVVAWRGNNVPCKFDMARFMILGSLAFDHPDPTLFCALTSPSDSVAGPNADFMILPPRWLVVENTFRPPTFHRNSVAEFLAVLIGTHEGKHDFVTGGASVHNNWAPHGPDFVSFERARFAEQNPQKLTDTLVVMLESRYPFHFTDAAINAACREKNYIESWKGFSNAFRKAVR